MPYNDATDAQGINHGLAARLGTSELPSTQVASEIFPTLAIGQEPELGFLGDWRWAAAYGSQAAVAGEYASVGVYNRSASGLLVRVEQFDVLSTATIAQYTCGFADPASWTGITGAGRFVDSRWGNVQTSARIVVSHAATRPDTNPVGIFNAISANNRFPGPFVIGPGAVFWISRTTVNTDCTVWFRWRERRAGDQELRGAVEYP